MKNLDRFDDEVKKEAAPDAAAVQKKKEKTALIKRGIMFTVKIFIYHFVTMIIYSFALSSIVAQDIRDGMGASDNIIFVFSVAAIILFSLIISFELSADGERRRGFLQLIKSEKMSPKLGIRLSLADALVYTAIYFIFQLPFCIFYHSFGFDHLYATAFEKYYVLDLGFMELTGIGILGALINCVLFFLCLILFRCLIYTKWSKDAIEK